MLVSIYDGAQLLETRECRTARLSDGRAGAIWRGLAFPFISSGDAIDIAGEAHAPLIGPQPSHARSFEIIAGINEAYVLIAGTVTERDRATAGFKAAGYEVLRSGRYLGEAMESFAADWFVRIVVPTDDLARLNQVAVDLFGQSTGLQPQRADLRLRLVTDELLLTTAKLKMLERKVLEAQENQQSSAASTEEIAALHTAIGLERERREAAEAEILRVYESQEGLFNDAENAAQIIARAEVRLPRGLGQEIADVFATFLPRIRVMRDTATCIAVEYDHRRAVYRALEELHTSAQGLPSAWKKLKGVEGWIERHVSNGQSDTGRIYARLNADDRTWDVLISHKVEQSRDIAWLKRQ